MTVRSCVAALAGVGIFTLLSATPASAATVDKATFERQLTAAAQPNVSAGMAVRTVQKMTINGASKPISFTASRVMNLNGSSISKSTFMGQSETRCVSRTTCYTRVGGKTGAWLSVKDGKGVTQVDDTLSYWSFQRPSDAATFDISGNTFTMTDTNIKWVTTTEGKKVTTTAALSDPTSSQTGVMVITQAPVRAVKVIIPQSASTTAPRR